jgi:acetyl esterase/lipase
LISLFCGGLQIELCYNCLVENETIHTIGKAQMKRFILVTICTFFSVISVYGQQGILPLWSEKIPNSQPSEEKETTRAGDILWIEKVQEPTLAVFLPVKRNATGKAVVVCPGGGYQGLAYDWEGIDIAKWLNSRGIAAFVLKYRLPRSASVKISHIAPLQDAQRALRMVRSNADQWNVRKDQIGIMGFSAGGHLASTLGTHYDRPNEFEEDAIDKQSARPDFMILIYPVITMKSPHTHQGSRDRLLGENPEEPLIAEYSNELHINADTPPTFIVHSTDDQAVPVENSLLFYQALKDAGVYVEMHIYPEGGHGYALAVGKGYLQSWPDRLADWIEGLK